MTQPTRSIRANADTQNPVFNGDLVATGEAANPDTLLGGLLPAAIIVKQDLASGMTFEQAAADAQTKTAVMVTFFHDPTAVEYAVQLALIIVVAISLTASVRPELSGEACTIRADLQGGLNALGVSNPTDVCTRLRRNARQEIVSRWRSCGRPRSVVLTAISENLPVNCGNRFSFLGGEYHEIRPISKSSERDHDLEVVGARRAVGASLVGIFSRTRERPFFQKVHAQSSPVAIPLAFTVNSTLDGGDSVINGVCETAPGNGQCTLRAAIQKANAHSGTDLINFNIPTSDPNCDVNDICTINLSAALPALTDSININGPGADFLSVRRNSSDKFRIFTVTGGTVSLSGLTIRDGAADNGVDFDGGGIFVDFSAPCTDYSAA